MPKIQFNLNRDDENIEKVVLFVGSALKDSISADLALDLTMNLISKDILMKHTALIEKLFRSVCAKVNSDDTAKFSGKLVKEYLIKHYLDAASSPLVQVR